MTTMCHDFGLLPGLYLRRYRALRAAVQHGARADGAEQQRKPVVINGLYFTISADPRGFPDLLRCSRPLARMLWKPGQSWCLSRFLHGYGTSQGWFCVKFRVDIEQELSQRPRYVTALCQSAAAGIIRLSDCTFARSVGSTSSVTFLCEIRVDNR